MSGRDFDDDALGSAVADIMRRAARLAILPRYRALQAHDVMEKSASDFVTVADRESEVLLAEALARLAPEAAIVGEEAAHANPALLAGLGEALCWIIDPLDGTNNFAAGKPPFGMIVALAEHGETIAGWIYDPLTDRCCHARRGGGAFVNGERVHSVGSRQAKPVVAMALELLDPRQTATMRDLLDRDFSIVGSPRCAAEQYPRVALGQNDIAFFNRTFAWDHAAGVLFLNEAGGKAARYDGSAYRVNDDKVGLLAASTPKLWDHMIELMKTLRGA